MRRCMVTGCSNTATTHWAVVPICNEHRQEIADETHRYYSRTIGREQRFVYAEIEHLTPWGRKVTAIGRKSVL